MVHKFLHGFTASSSGSFTFNEFNGPCQPELSERRVPFRHVTIMDLHSPTFEIQLMSCHMFVLITRSRICVMSRPEEQLQRLVKDVARRGLEWAQTSVSELGRDDLRGICRAAGLAVLSNSKWLTVSQLREALLSYLANESVVTWGVPDSGGDTSDIQHELKGVQQVQATNCAFAAILAGGSVLPWGDKDLSGYLTPKKQLFGYM